MYYVTVPEKGEYIIPKSLFESLSAQLFDAFLFKLNLCKSRKMAEFYLKRYCALEADVSSVYDRYGVPYGSGGSERFREMIDERFPLNEDSDNV